MHLQSANISTHTARLTYPNGMILEFNTENQNSLNRLTETLKSALPQNPQAHRRYDHINPATYTLSALFDDTIETIIDNEDYAEKSKALASSRLKKIRDFLTLGDSGRLASTLSSIDSHCVKVGLKRHLQKITGKSYRTTTLIMYYRLYNRVVSDASSRMLITETPTIAYKQQRHTTITMPLADDQLSQLLGGWMYKDYNTEKTSLNKTASSWKFWLIPMGLYTGARLNELCQLRVGDIFLDKNSNWTIRIHERLDSQSCKNSTSQRDIPVHTALIDMGFADFINEQKQRLGSKSLLFPELKHSTMHNFSRAPSRFFSGNKRGEGYIGSIRSEHERNCPSFRNLRCTFATVLARNGTAPSSIALMLGHADEKTEMAISHYLPVIPIEMKQKILTDGLKYDIDLSHIHWRHYTPLMESQKHQCSRGRRPK